MQRRRVDLVRVIPAFVALTMAATEARATAAETISARATVKNAQGVSASFPVMVTVAGFSTDAERRALLASLKNGRVSGAHDLLSKGDDLGFVQANAHRTPIKYAYERVTATGRLITIVTAEPLIFIGAGHAATKTRAGYELGLLILEIGDSGPGHGELVPATKIQVDAQGAIVAEDESGDVVLLSNVVVGP